MERIAEEQLDHQLAGPELRGKPLQPGFVLVGRGSERELIPQLLGEPPLETDGGLKVDPVDLGDKAERLPQLLLGEPLHADQETAAVPLSTRPTLDEAVDVLPSPEIEVADTEVGAMGERKPLPQSREESMLNVVENPWHPGLGSGKG